MTFMFANGLTVLAWTIAGLWIVIAIAYLRACCGRSSLKPMTAAPEAGLLPSLSVVIASKNEEACIEKCIRSLFLQDYPAMEVVAVNDRSTDATGAILDRLMIEFPDRLRVVHVTALPGGWFGKPHALEQGMKVATGRAVCFSDADCEFLAPSAMRTAMTEMLRSGADLISIAASYTMDTVRECVTVPCCSEAILSWLRPERISDPNWPDAFANGAFIMVNRAPFERIGGWSAVRAKISEDLELARLAKRSGLRLHLAQGEGFYQTASYKTPLESWNGWSRIFNGALSPSQLLVTVLRMSILFVLPLAATVYGLCLSVRTNSLTWFTHGAGQGFLIAFAVRTALDVVMFRIVGAPIYTASLAPCGRIFVMAASIRALLSHAGLARTHWRGANFVSGRMILPQQAKA